MENKVAREKERRKRTEGKREGERGNEAKKG